VTDNVSTGHIVVGPSQNICWLFAEVEEVEFREYSLYDPGAYPEPPLSRKITWRVTQPWAEPADEKEQAAVSKAKALIERLRARAKGK
jgi:hypothetical protein